MKNTDLFGNEVVDNPLLKDRFIEPPFSILDSKTSRWRSRVDKWTRIGIKGELGRTGYIREPSGNLSVEGARKAGHTVNEGVSIFNPALAELMYHWFCPVGGLILDPFAGGSVRGIVANYMGFKYSGIDIRQEQIDSNREQALDILPINNQPNWYVGDSNEVLECKFNSKFDLVFSCPPYSYLEKYSDISGDISNMPYDLFLTTYRSIISKCVKHLKQGGYVVFVVGEIRNKDGNYIGFVPDTIRAMTDAGLNYYNECIFLQGLGGACLNAGRFMEKTKKVKKIHQNVLIFKNPIL